jgi:hypothetical protein
MIRICQR